MTEEFEAWKAEQAACWLSRIRRARGAYLAALGALEEAEAAAEGVDGIDYSRQQVSSSCSCARMESMMPRIEAARARVSERRDELDAMADEAFARLSCMPDAALARLLWRYYVRGLEWDEAGASLGWSHDQTMRRRRRALAMAFEVMPADFRPPMPRAL